MRHRWKRPLLLFVFALFVPAAVLVTLAVRLVHQETELAAKRVEAARRDASEELRRELSAKLDGIKASFGALPPANPAIVFVARLEQDRIVLPWDDRPARSRPPAEVMGLHHEGRRTSSCETIPLPPQPRIEKRFPPRIAMWRSARTA